MVQNEALHTRILDKIQTYLKVEKESTEKIFHQLALIIYQQQTSENDLYVLAKILKEEDLISLISYYDGDTLKIPTKKEYRESLFLVIVFFLKEIQGKSWNEIRDILDLSEKSGNLSTISLGKKLSLIKDEMRGQLEKFLKGVDSKSLESLIEKAKTKNLKGKKK